MNANDKLNSLLLEKEEVLKSLREVTPQTDSENNLLGELLSIEYQLNSLFKSSKFLI